MRTSKLISLTVFVTAVIVISAGSAQAGPPADPGSNGNGPAAKATGSGYWTNGGGDDFYAEFEAHEAKGNRAAKGSLHQKRVDGVFGGFIVEVDVVTVHDGYACFGGVTTEAWGAYENRLDQVRWTLVEDGGEGPEAEDFLRGSWTNSAPSFCTTGDEGGNLPWSDGNVQIHPATP